jgi:predicted PurR-regulated permease PerM
MNKAILNFIIFLLVVAFLAWYFVDIFVYIIIALVLSSILRTPTNYISSIQLYRVRVPRIVATLLSFVIIIGILTLFIYLFVPLVLNQVEVISNIDFEKWVTQTMIPIQFVEDFLLDNKLVNEKRGFLVEVVKETAFNLLGEFKITNFINNVVSITGSFLVGLLAVFFITFFMLYEKGLIRKNLISLIPNKYFEVSIAALSKTEKSLSNYLLGLFLQMVSIFSIVSFGLLIVGVDYAVTIAVTAAIANLIPYIGPIIGGTFGLIVGLTTSTGLETANDYLILVGKILAVFSVTQFTDNILLQPIIFSKSVKAHPLEIFLIVFVGANIAGGVGMIAAIPTYTILKVCFVEFYKGYRQYQVFRD